MARCPSCGADNPAEFRFCGACGTSLSNTACRACGFENANDQGFCGRCGASLSTQNTVEDLSPALGQRKLATVLFADVVGFTSLAEDTDPETLARTVDAALRRMAEIVVDHGGTVDKYLGDALMALFGVPLAHGDDAERALAAALAMCEADVGLRFSIGVNSGEVMVGELGEGGGVTAIGDAVNVAARLEKAAGAGEILIGALTAELVADRFVLRERETALLKGKRRPVAVYQVMGRRTAAELATGPEPVLIDRDDELEFLRSCWKAATARYRSQLVLLTGEAGIGKSRLARELARAAASDGLVVEAACPGYGSLVGARLGLDLVRQLSGSAVDGVNLDEEGVLQLRRLISSRVAERPLLLSIDDCHNASAADLDPLAQLAARCADLPVMFLLVGRSQPPAWLSRFSGATTIGVAPLSSAGAQSLAAAIELDHPLAPEAAMEIATRSGGNPLHLRELLRLLHSSAELVVRDGEYRLDGRPHLPATLNAVLSARLDALPPGDRTVLQDVAIFSDGATAAEVAAVARAEVAAPLDRLVTSGLLHEADSGRFEVADPLLHEVAYEQLPRATRGERHRRAADVAATDLGRARHLGLAAGYLSEDAALRDRAADALAAAGIELVERSNYRGGIDLLRQAVDLGERDPYTLLRLAQAETDVGRWKEALAILDLVETGGDPRLEAEVIHARGNELGDDAERAIELLADAAELWAALGDDGKRAWALANRSVALFRMGRVDEAAASIDEALAIFQRLGDRTGIAASGQQLALVRPDDPRLPTWLADGVAFAEESGDLAQMRNALIPLAWVRFVRSQLGGPAFATDALADSERLARVAGEIGDAVFEVQGHCLAAVLQRLDGDLEAAEASLRQARRAVPGGDSLSQSFLAACSFMVSLARGADPGARPAPASIPGPIEVMADAIIVEGLLLAGHVDAAAAHLASSALDIGPASSPVLGRLIGITRGAVLVLAGRYDEAEESLEAAREAARAVGAVPTEAATAALLAEIRWCQGREDEARALLEEVSTNPGGIAELLCDRVRALLGDAAAERRLTEGSDRLVAPGLAHMPKVAEAS